VDYGLLRLRQLRRAHRFRAHTVMRNWYFRERCA
jgi:hypothetical protein